MKAAPHTKTIRVGSMRLDVRRYADGRYGFDFQPRGGERTKVRLNNPADAEARAKEMLAAASAGQVQCFDEDEYAEFLRWRSEKKRVALIAEIVPSFLSAKRNKGVTPATLRELSGVLEPFARAFSGSLSDLQRRDVERWLDSRRIGPRRWNNMRAAIVALHHFARRDGLLPAELTPVERMERRKVTPKVETYTPDELRRLLDAVTEISPEWVAPIALGAFAGLRPQEVVPDPRGGGWKPGLKWENILWAKGKIDVPAAVAKDRRRRFVPILPALVAWLAPYRRASGPVAPSGTGDKLKVLWLKRADLDWRNDALRHSYASHRLSVIKDMAALALEMGNSPAMIFKHYLDLKHDEEAAEWFAVRPQSTPSNIAAFVS
jgi:integrase